MRVDINFNEDGSGQPSSPVDVDALARDLNPPRTRQDIQGEKLLREWAKEQEKQRKEDARSQEAERRERRNERGRIQRESERNVAGAAKDRVRESRSDSPQSSASTSESNDSGIDFRSPIEGFLRDHLHRSRLGRSALFAADLGSGVFQRGKQVAQKLQAAKTASNVVKAASAATGSSDGFELLHEDSKPLDVDSLAKELKARPKGIFSPGRSAMFASGPRVLPGLLSKSTGTVVGAGGGGVLPPAGAAAGASGAGGGGLGAATGALGGSLGGAATLGGAALGGFAIAIGAAAAVAAAFYAVERAAYSSANTLRTELGERMPSIAVARAMANADKTLLALSLDSRIGGRLGLLESSEAMRDRFSLRRDAAIYELLGPFTELRELFMVSGSFVITDALEKFAAANREQGGLFGAYLETVTLGLADGGKTANDILKLLKLIAGKNDTNADKFLRKLGMATEAAKPPIAFGPPSGGAL